METHLHYAISIKWLYYHEHPSSITTDMNIVILSHPRGDGDGMATRMGRLVGRIVPHILKGDIVILQGGFRGYTHPVTGFESLFEPFSNIKKNLDGKYIIFENQSLLDWEKNIPASLEKKSKDKKWWYGVILNYFMRPNIDLKKYIDDKFSRLNIPSNYIGMHIRRGDNSVGLKYGFEDYYKVLTDEIIPFWKKNDITPSSPTVYLATDSLEILSRFSDEFDEFRMAFEKTDSLDMSRPGQSAANIMIRNEKNADFVLKIAYEVMADIMLLSNSVFLVGIMTSQITKIAAAMSHVRENNIHAPIALDYSERIEWVRSNIYELYNGDVTPFVKVIGFIHRSL